MKRFKNILCFVDPIQNAQSTVKHAYQLAKLNDAKLTFVTIIEPISVTIPSLQDAFIELRKNALEDLISLVGQLDISNIDHRVISEPYGPLNIIHMVLKEGFDIVLKPAENPKRSPHLFGSSDQHLLRKCPVPVWITNSDKSENIKKILVAVDVDPEEPENAPLNEVLLKLAHSIAEIYTAELHIVHAWYLRDEHGLMTTGSENLIKLAKQGSIELEANRKKAWDNLIERSGTQPNTYTLHWIKGEPEKVISELANSIDIDLVVMGTVARTGIPGFFIGNTAEQILMNINCSTLAVKPASFRSPLVD